MGRYLFLPTVSCPLLFELTWPSSRQTCEADQVCLQCPLPTTSSCLLSAQCVLLLMIVSLSHPRKACSSQAASHASSELPHYVSCLAFFNDSRVRVRPPSGWGLQRREPSNSCLSIQLGYPERFPPSLVISKHRAHPWWTVLNPPPKPPFPSLRTILCDPGVVWFLRADKPQNERKPFLDHHVSHCSVFKATVFQVDILRKV